MSENRTLGDVFRLDKPKDDWYQLRCPVCKEDWIEGDEVRFDYSRKFEDLVHADCVATPEEEGK